MPLRNGKSYLKNHLCQKCQVFYSHKQFGYQCSGCSEIEGITPSTEPLPELLEWVEKNTLNTSLPRYKSLFQTIQKKLEDHPGCQWNDIVLFGFLNTLEKKGLWLKAEDAIKLLSSSDSSVREHIVASKVADWWNIKSTPTGKWKSYLACYYGQFNSPFPPRTIPPRPPNEMTPTTEIHNFLNIVRNAAAFT
jgi:hypothetical protein